MRRTPSTAAFAQDQDQDQDQVPTPPRATKLVPSLRRAPKIDGTLSDLKQGLSLNPSEGNAWTAKVGYQKDSVYVGVSAKDEAVTNADLVELSIFFPGAGTTATGHVWRFAIDGLRATNDEALPDFAAELTRSKVVKTKTGFSIGGVSPLAHAEPPVTLIDRELFRFEEIWAAAGHPHGVFKLRPQDLERLTGAPVADVVQAPPA